MKKIRKNSEPTRLANYKQKVPHGTWENFCKSKTRKKQVQDQLRLDQCTLCAYCEVDLLQGTAPVLSDFRVEHFHPKSDVSAAYNWHLDWKNLFACCHGGSQKNVIDAGTRFTSPDLSCDAFKADKNLDSLILNPLTDIPAFPVIFEFSRTTGSVVVHNQNCAAAQISVQKAQNTIDKLNLNAIRLKKMRKDKLDFLNDKIRESVKNGKNIQNSLENLAQAVLKKNSSGEWPSFFSAIRSFLGVTAEKHLRQIGYNG